MRLLHSTKLEFQEFHDQNIPSYAILSHRWGKDEVSFQEMQFLMLSPHDQKRVLTPALLNMEAKTQGQGYRKVLDFRKYAAAIGHKWVWVDTVCIDKTSSAELSEAINSMWKWYENSAICYAYLSDVSCSRNSSELETELLRSEWFKRGWTLQELIAPKHVNFLNSAWSFICDKASHAQMIQEICGVPESCLGSSETQQGPRAYTVAMRMSWARERHTTRKEDEAYCLMGLFSVHMPLLYGEGERAMLRLCEEIIKGSNDDSIFLHDGKSLLPQSPNEFHTSRKYESLTYSPGRRDIENVYSLTKGCVYVQNELSTQRRLHAEIWGERRYKYLKLNCRMNDAAEIMILEQDDRRRGKSDHHKFTGVHLDGTLLDSEELDLVNQWKRQACEALVRDYDKTGHFMYIDLRPSIVLSAERPIELDDSTRPTLP